MEEANSLLADIYLQVELYEAFSKMVVINMHQRLYQNRCLPFGLSYAPAIFQKIKDHTVADIPVVCYLDGLVVTGKTDRKHTSNFQKTLDRLRTSRIHLKMNKCQFFQPEV